MNELPVRFELKVLSEEPENPEINIFRHGDVSKISDDYLGLLVTS